MPSPMLPGPGRYPCWQCTVHVQSLQQRTFRPHGSKGVAMVRRMHFNLPKCFGASLRAIAGLKADQSPLPSNPASVMHPFNCHTQALVMQLKTGCMYCRVMVLPLLEAPKPSCPEDNAPVCRVHGSFVRVRASVKGCIRGVSVHVVLCILGVLIMSTLHNTVDART